jgi:hypothetical protein
MLDTSAGTSPARRHRPKHPQSDRPNPRASRCRQPFRTRDTPLARTDDGYGRRIRWIPTTSWLPPFIGRVRLRIHVQPQIEVVDTQALERHLEDRARSCHRRDADADDLLVLDRPLLLAGQARKQPVACVACWPATSGCSFLARSRYAARIRPGLSARETPRIM